MRPLLALAIALLAAAPAAAAPASRDLAARLDAARERYLASLGRPVSAHEVDERYRPRGWFQPPAPPALAAYDELVREVGRTAWARDPGDPYFRRKGLWVRPYAIDASGLRVCEVFDRAQALGATEIYLETFYGGRVTYTGGRAFPPRWQQLNVARAYAREARHRGVKLYAWLHTLRWGEDQLHGGFAEPVVDGWQRSPFAAEGKGSAFVSPSSPAVRARLGKLFDEIAASGYFDGVWLDYLRYPLAVRRDAPPDPRDFWGYGPAARAALARERPDLSTPEFQAFLRDGTAPDEVTRQHWLAHWRGFLARELRDVLVDARERLGGRVRLGVAFHPGVYLRPFDARAQDALAWLPLCDDMAAMCYAYDPELDPADASAARATIDRELAVVEAGVTALKGGRRAELMASLAADPPGSGAARKHWPLMAQLAYLKGRRMEGAFGSLEGVAMFSYGWLWPQSDAARQAAEDGAAGAGRVPAAGL